LTKGRTVYRNSNTGVQVTVSKPAEQLIGPERVPEFVKQLTEFLEILGAKSAQVSKCGFSVEIFFLWPGGGGYHWKVPVKR